MAKRITLTDDQIKILNDINNYLNMEDFSQMFGVSESEAVCLATPWDDLMAKVNG